MCFPVKCAKIREIFSSGAKFIVKTKGNNEKPDDKKINGGKEMTKKEFIATIAEKAGVAPKEATAFFNAFAESLEEVLKSGEKIQIIGFGNFELKVKAARDGLNPATGEKIKIAASKVPAFRPAKQFKDLFN